MNNTNFSLKTILLFSILVLLFSSCSKDDAVGQDYVGTWSAITTDEDVLIKNTKTFTKNGFTDIGQVCYPSTTNWVDFSKATGSISVSNSTMTVTYKSIGFSDFDPLTSKYSGKIVMYNEGSSVFQILITDSIKTFTALYSISDNKITFKTDIRNGEFTNFNKTTVFTKQ